MKATIGSNATASVIQRISTPAGPLSPEHILQQNVAADLAEQSSSIRYPVAHVYCEKIVNGMAEKFRTFSGTVHMAIELRYSHDRLERLQEALESGADGIVQVLNVSRGDWSNGLYYRGGYQVTFGPAKRGGKNFIQMAKVTFEIGVSIS